jgi:hypothetical protein
MNDKVIIDCFYKFLENPISGYLDFLDLGDLRVKDWFGMSSPFPTIGLSLTYVLIVKVNI